MQLQLFLTYKNCEYKNTLLLSTTYGGLKKILKMQLMQHKKKYILLTKI